MKRLIVNLALLVLTFVIGVSLSSLRPMDQRLSRQARESESYAVYSAMINEFYAEDGSPVVLYDTTSSWPSYREQAAEFTIVRKNFPKVQMPEILRDFSSENQTHHTLTSRFALTIPYALVSDNGWYLSTNESIGEFHDKYPKSRGMLALSAVGFNAKMDHAVVYARTYCPGDCGGGFYLLIKQDGVWTVAEWQLG